MPIKRVLVGYDGTEHSERALQFAVGINEDYETEIHLAFIVNEPAGMALRYMCKENKIMRLLIRGHQISKPI